MTIRNGIDVTVERGAFENDAHSGKNARVVKVIRGFFAVIDIDGVDNYRGALLDCLQPRMTAATYAILTGAAAE